MSEENPRIPVTLHKNTHTMHVIRISFLLLFFLPALHAQSDLERMLFDLEGVVFRQIETPEGFESAWELKIKQPLDHENPDKGSFYQRVFLSHRNMDAPVVLVTEGYQRPVNWIYELTRLAGGNQIQVEHRFFGASVPDSVDYSLLNASQFTADLHRINELMKEIYPENLRLSTGISKGGMTTLFYKYFYPDDVDVAIPYVAPVILDFKDPRIYDFLDTVGTDECREKIVDFQRLMLERKDDLLPLVKWYSKGADLAFDRLGLEGAFEYAVLEYSFSFWQWGHDCEAIPGRGASDDELLAHFLEISNVDFFSDAIIDGYAPFYYQMGTEMGYYGYETDAFPGLIDALEKEPSAVFMPEGHEPAFDPALTVKLYNWLRESGERILYINGGWDTWSATRMIPSPGVDALVIDLSQADHRKARIAQMTAEQKALVAATLKRWSGLEIQITE